MGAVLVLPLIFVPVVIVCSIIGIILGIYFARRSKGLPVLKFLGGLFIGLLLAFLILLAVGLSLN